MLSVTFGRVPTPGEIAIEGNGGIRLVPPELPIEPPPRGFSPSDPHTHTARFAGGLSRAVRRGSRKQRVWLLIVFGAFGIGLVFVLLALLGWID
jgi:hypothetical protein